MNVYLLAYHVSIKISHSYQGLGKVKVKVKFTPEQATKVQRGSRGVALLLL